MSKKPIDPSYSTLILKIELNPKSLKFKIGDRVRFAKYKYTFSKGYTENWSKEIFVVDSVLKTNHWTYKIKDLNGEEIIGIF